MIYDLNKIDTNPFKEKTFDVCIIGSGPAGISLALHLRKDLKILLLEAGDREYTEESQDIYKGKNVGHEYFNLEDCRGRWFGGSSNLWGGWCGTYDEHDFEKKDFIEYSEWPISKKDLDPYIERAKILFGITEEKKPMIKGWDDVLSGRNEYIEGFTIWMPDPSYFIRTNGPKIESSSNVTCYLNANVTDIKLNANLSHVTSIEVQNYQDKKFDVRAKIVVLAAGGIENPRLLLNFNKQCKKGIGNDHDMVGRCFNEHPHADIGYYILEDHMIDRALSSHRSFNRHFVQPTEKFYNEEDILHVGLEIKPKEIVEEDRSRAGFKKMIKDIICSSDWLLEMANKYHKYKIQCYKSDYEKSNGVIKVATESAPNPASRITLGEEKDRFGLRRLILDWQTLEIDKYSVKRTALKFGELMARKNIGRIKLDKWLLDDDVKNFPGFPHRVGGPHHMCTTRMSSSPKDGVVDANQKIFGIDNFYIAGSSVFSSGGYMNPTFQIVQMSLRLADHLNDVVSKHS